MTNKAKRTASEALSPRLPLHYDCGGGMPGESSPRPSSAAQTLKWNQRRAASSSSSMVDIETVSALNNIGVSNFPDAGNHKAADLQGAEGWFVEALRRIEECRKAMNVPSMPSSLPLLSQLSAGRVNGDDHTMDIDVDPEKGIKQSTSSVSSSNNESFYAYQRGSYDEGMSSYSTPFHIGDSSFTPSSSGRPSSVIDVQRARATILYNIGLVNDRAGQYVDAASCFTEALAIKEVDHVDDGSASYLDSTTTTPSGGGITSVAILHSLGRIHYRAGQYDLAIRQYQNALALTQHHFGEHHLDVASALNCIGVAHLHKCGSGGIKGEPRDDGNAVQHAEKALESFEQSLVIRRQILGDNHPDVATTLNNIGRVYYMMGEYNKALNVYRKALRIRTCVLGAYHLDVAATLYNAGQTLHQLRNLDGAMNMYRRFIDVAQAKLGPDHRDVAAMLKCMAQIHHERKQYEDAETLFNEALQRAKMALGDFHPEIASTLNKIGTLYHDWGDMDKALHAYQEGLRVERAVLDPDHPNIAVTLTNIGQIHKQRGEYKLALKLYLEALTHQRRISGPDHPHIAAILSNIGLLHHQVRSLDRALDVYQEALRIHREAHGNNHLDVASTLNSIGLVLFQLGKLDIAMLAFKEALRIRRTLLGKDHHDTSILLYNIATIHLESGNETEALMYYGGALRIERNALGPHHPSVISTLKHIGRVRQQQGDLEKALSYYKEALDIERREGDTNLAVTLNSIGNIYLQRGQIAEMMRVFSESSRIRLLRGQNFITELQISGFKLYALSKKHPECAAVA